MRKEELKPYLCGAINGCTDAEAKDWRQRMLAHFPSAINPMNRDYRGQEQASYREIVDLDKLDVRHSTLVVANYVKPSVGTSMEVFYAHTLGKPVLLWCPASAERSLSPWLRYHSSAIVTRFDAVLDKVEEWFGSWS